MSATALNLFHNFLLRREAKDQSLSIAVNNHPLPRNASEEVVKPFLKINEYRVILLIDLQFDNATVDVAVIATFVGFFVTFAFSIMIASFVVVPVEEKEKKVKSVINIL